MSFLGRSVCMCARACLRVCVLGQKVFQKGQESIPDSVINVNKGWCNICEATCTRLWMNTEGITAIRDRESPEGE